MMETLTLREGTVRDYDRLSRFHYRAGRPATVVRVLAMDPPAGDGPAAVLVVSMPTLNGSWRAAALPGLPAGDKRAAAAWLNAHVRTISRVVVDPRWRGLGLARGVVERYLADPLTPWTEAVAAMGRFCPFFERAGMRPVPCRRSRTDRRLLEALRRLDLGPLDLPALRARPGRAVEAALRAWARSSRRTVRRAHAPTRELARLAASCLGVVPVAYVHGPATPAGPG